jgi:hypothetical protein
VALRDRFRLLVLNARYPTRLSYFDDWLDAFVGSDLFDAIDLNIVGGDAAERLPALQNEVDGIVMLHSVNGDTTEYLEPLAPILAERRVPLLSFVGNEVNLPGSPIAAKRDVFARLGPDWIATQLLQNTGEFLFGDVCRRGVVAIPHALNPQAFRPELDLSSRPIEVGVRAARYLPHLGDDDRNRLLDFFASLGRNGRVTVDIGNDRFTREGWAGFLNRCQATVATEAGSWFVERDDATIEKIRAYVRERTGPGIVIPNDSPLRRLGHKLPWGVREFLRKILRSGLVRHESLISADPAEIHRIFFVNRPRAPVYGKGLSSRHFDAIGTKTLQIMFPGRYNDILVAGRHYVAIAPDFSNLDEVLGVLRDPRARQAIVDEAYSFALDRHTYAHRVADVHRLLSS